MNKGTSPVDREMRSEYDFSGGLRGKYAERFAAGTNVAVLSPDVAQEFPDSASVNEALCALIKIVRRRRVLHTRS